MRYVRIAFRLKVVRRLCSIRRVRERRRSRIPVFRSSGGRRMRCVGNDAVPYVPVPRLTQWTTAECGFPSPGARRTCNTATPGCSPTIAARRGGWCTPGFPESVCFTSGIDASREVHDARVWHAGLSCRRLTPWAPLAPGKVVREICPRARRWLGQLARRSGRQGPRWRRLRPHESGRLLRN